MSKSVKPIPDGFGTVTPYLIVGDAAKALDFYTRAFGAEEKMRLPGPGGKIMHAEIKIGSSQLMLAEECAEMGARSPHSVGGSPITLVLYVADCDALFDQAVKAGATIKRPLTNQFYGDRSGSLEDPFGHQWHISTHVEDVSAEEIKARMAAMKH